jgi:DNA-binding YbaB/EbfC family protein
VLKGLGNLANIGSLLKQAQQMTGKLRQTMEDLKTRRVEGSSGGGMVSVEANGAGEVIACRIDPSLVTAGDREMIEDLLPSAINHALAKSKQLQTEAMKSMTEGIELGDLNSILSQLSGGNTSGPSS